MLTQRVANNANCLQKRVVYKREWLTKGSYIHHTNELPTERVAGIIIIIIEKIIIIRVQITIEQ